MRRLGRLAFLLAVLASVAPRVSAQTRGQATAPAVDRALLQSLAGEYTAGTITMTVTLLEDGTLTLFFPGQQLYHLVPETRFRYRMRELNPGFGIEFLRNVTGTVTGMTVRQPPPQQDFSAVRKPGQIVRAPQPGYANQPSLESLAGDYQVQGQIVQIRLRDDGVLTVAVPPQPVRDLEPAGNLRFAQKGLPGYSVDFVRDPSGNVVSLTFHQPNGDFGAARVPGQTARAAPPVPLPPPPAPRVPQPVAPPPPAQAPAARPSPPAAPPAPARSAAVAPASAPAAPATGIELTAASFSTVGLNYERDLAGLFLGDFDHLRIGRNSMEFYKLFSTYLDAFARRCSASLPPNKVEMIGTECAREQYMVDKYGNQVSVSTCVEYRDVHTGLYAAPDLLAASKQLGSALAADLMKEVVRLSTTDPLATAMRARDAATTVGRDMQSLIEKNGCDSPGLQRFQANMLRFARNEPALRLAGGETIASTGPARPAPGTPFKDADYAKLLDDLIVEQSQAWMMNRYFRGSLSGVTVAARNADGRPLAGC